MAIEERNLNRRIARNHAQPIIRESQLRNHLGAQHAGDVRSGGDAAAGRDLFGDATAADNLAALQHERGESGLGQISCGGESVVAGADDNGVVTST